MRLNERLKTLTFLFAFLAAENAGRAADKPPLPSGLTTYPRGGPARTGAYPKFHLPEKPKSGWKADLDKHTGTPVVAGDRFIVGNGDNALIALSLKDDSVLWFNAEQEFRVYSAPVVIDDRIFCASQRGVSAHALADGNEIWRRDVAGGADGSSPLVVGDLVVAGGNDGFVYAWDARSGAERWKADIVKDAPADPPGFDGQRARIGDNRARPGTAASDGINVYISIFDQSRVVALDLKTGAPRWSYQTKGWIGGMPTVAEGKVFFGSQDHKVYAVDASTGKFVWSFETRWRTDGNLAYDDGSVFCSASDGRCYRIDARNGVKIWEYETPLNLNKKHDFLSAPLLDATAVYFGSWDGHLYALNRADGTLKWKHQPAQNHEHVHAPSTDGQRLFVPLSPLFDEKAQSELPGLHGIVAIEADKP